MIPFLEPKRYHGTQVEKYLELSKGENQWTNFGPVNRLLDKTLEERFGKQVHMCCSGTAALWTAMLYWQERLQKRLKWGMCSFTFPCVPQSLFDVEFIDCTPNGMLDLDQADRFDGIIATNLFGGFDMTPYKKYAQEKSKVLVIDGAMNFDTSAHDEFEMISFHHTKPWGFGEAGCLLIPPGEKSTFHAITNFGKAITKRSYRQHSLNAKLSELAAAGVMQRLNDYDQYAPIYQEQYRRIKTLAEKLDYEVVGTHNTGTPCFVPIKHTKEIHHIKNDLIVLGKYYEPVIPTPNAIHLYNHMVSFPCHPGVTKLRDDEIVRLLYMITL